MRMRALFLIALFALCMIDSVHAQPQPTTKPARMVFRDDSDNKDDDPNPVRLAKAEVSVLIRGYLAQTTMTMTFANDSDQIRGGELIFPLPADATVSGYALDIDGQLVEGVAVEKQKARISYEEEVRTRVDPGLIEHVVGNNFKTRIYPINSKSTRTVQIQYVSMVDFSAAGGSATLRVPLNFASGLKEIAYKIDVTNVPALPGTQASGLQFANRNEAFYASGTVDPAIGELLVDLGNLGESWSLVERRQAAPRMESDSRVTTGETADYFVAVDVPEIPKIKRAFNKPTKIGILWDASLSRAGADRKSEFDLIEAIAQNVGEVEIELVVFRDQPEPARTFAVKNGSAKELVDALKSVVYDGATDFSKLELKSAMPSYWLLFSDGLSNLGAAPHAFDVPLYAISNDTQVNPALLGQLAKESGAGAYFDLRRTTAEEIVRELGYPGYGVTSIDFKPGQIADVYSIPQSHGRFVFTGRLLDVEATLTVNYGIGGQVMDTRKITIKSPETSTLSHVAPRFWAQQKVAALSANAAANDDELTQVGLDFQMVTPNTSLLVLENAAQYVLYRVVPPKSRPELYNAFIAEIERQTNVDRLQRQEKIQIVLGMWEDRVKWWETKFEYKDDFKYQLTTQPTTQPILTEEGISVQALEQAEPSGNAGQGRGFGSGSGQGGGWGGGAPAAPLGGADERDTPTSPTINIKPWTPDTPYLKAMTEAGSEGVYAVFLKERESFGDSPSYYLDCGDFLLKNGQKDLGIRVLTDVVELNLEDARLLRIAAHRLAQAGERDLAIDLFEQVLRLRPEEPQSFRDLALVLADRADAGGGNTEQIAKDYSRALYLLNEVIMGKWRRFEGIEVVALMEANRIIPKLQAIVPKEKFVQPIDSRLVKLLDLDVRIVLTWDTDSSDMDLWVTEPSGETCIYNHNRTTIGGLMSRDFTQGYGPEEYCLRNLMPGKYVIQANYYGTGNRELIGPTTVQATVITHFGREDEKRESLTLRLSTTKEVVDIGTVTLEK